MFNRLCARNDDDRHHHLVYHRARIDSSLYTLALALAILISLFVARGCVCVCVLWPRVAIN